MTTEVKKLTNTKEVIAYLAEKFPKCFSVEGNAQPLKIGIFDDLAQRLTDDEAVSKTRLRTALRHYTNSWRYLRSVKAGAQRVDLDGQDAGLIEQQHQEHAEQTLTESKAAAAKRAAEKKRDAAPAADATARKARAQRPAKAKPKTAKPAAKAKPAQPKQQLEAVEAQELNVGQDVLVKAGKAPIAGQITEIDRGEIHVQLRNGLTVKVDVKAVFVAKQE